MQSSWEDCGVRKPGCGHCDKALVFCRQSVRSHVYLVFVELAFKIRNILMWTGPAEQPSNSPVCVILYASSSVAKPIITQQTLNRRQCLLFPTQLLHNRCNIFLPVQSSREWLRSELGKKGPRDWLCLPPLALRAPGVEGKGCRAYLAGAMLLCSQPVSWPGIWIRILQPLNVDPKQLFPLRGAPWLKTRFRIPWTCRAPLRKRWDWLLPS